VIPFKIQKYMMTIYFVSYESMFYFSLYDISYFL